MSSETGDRRTRVRALVQQILDSVPTESSPEPQHYPEHVLVNSIEDERSREYDRDESAKQLITEDDLRGLKAGSRIRIAENARLTPLAEDLVKEREYQLIRKPKRGPELFVASVSIGADHGGFRSKEALKPYLSGLGLKVRDFGTNSQDAVDYPEIAHAVARSVAEGQCDIGLIIDGAGIGSAVTANKVPGVRAAACYNAALARNSREHNGANILTLGSGQNSIDEMKEIVNAFVTTRLVEDRHVRRVGMIEAVEKQYAKR